jgi:hypothetical protein
VSSFGAVERAHTNYLIGRAFNPCLTHLCGQLVGAHLLLKGLVAISRRTISGPSLTRETHPRGYHLYAVRGTSNYRFSIRESIMKLLNICLFSAGKASAHLVAVARGDLAVRVHVEVQLCISWL